YKSLSAYVPYDRLFQFAVHVTQNLKQKILQLLILLLDINEQALRLLILLDLRTSFELDINLVKRQVTVFLLFVETLVKTPILHLPIMPIIIDHLHMPTLLERVFLTLFFVKNFELNLPI